MPLTFITGNLGKAEELQRGLSLHVDHIKIDLEEIQSLDLEEVVLHKTKEAYRKLKKPIITEDTALIFESFNRLPGPLIKWFLKDMKNEGLCNILDNFASRKATALSMFGYTDGVIFKTFAGEIEGKIATEPRGSNGFGWDAIFIPNGSAKTFAEMNQPEKDQFSMRGLALKKLKQYLLKK